ncbi:MAG: hypothetical protein Q8P87_00895 [bacterium]|nr:hypothetical protein [bacterium]
MQKPRNETIQILDAAMKHINAVPYKVSLRWVFYRLLQDGIFTSKGAYSTLKDLTSRARKSFYGDWKPDTLVDATRESIINHGGHSTIEQVVASYARNTVIKFNPWIEQDNYLEVWFEAKAMTNQFQSIIGDEIVLVPFGGDPSLDFKWRIAKRIENYFFKKVVILYFGDLDPKGEQIPNSAAADILPWSGLTENVNFEIVRCGLNPEHISKYSVPENPDKLGEYQWEALDDNSAREIIEENIAKYVDLVKIEEHREKEQIATLQFREYLENFTY